MEAAPGPSRRAASSRFIASGGGALLGVGLKRSGWRRSIDARDRRAEGRGGVRGPISMRTDGTGSRLGAMAPTNRRHALYY